MSPGLARYLLVGIFSNLLNYSIYILLGYFGLSLFASSAIGYLTGLIVSYHFGRIWVFDHKFNISGQNVIRFVSVYLTGGLGMSTLTEWLSSAMGFDYRLSWLCGAGFAVVNNFFGLKWLVFNRAGENNGI